MCVFLCYFAYLEREDLWQMIYSAETLLRFLYDIYSFRFRLRDKWQVSLRCSLLDETSFLRAVTYKFCERVSLMWKHNSEIYTCERKIE